MASHLACFLWASESAELGYLSREGVFLTNSFGYLHDSKGIFWQETTERSRIPRFEQNVFMHCVTRGIGLHVDTTAHTEAPVYFLTKWEFLLPIVYKYILELFLKYFNNDFNGVYWTKIIKHFQQEVHFLLNSTFLKPLFLLHSGIAHSLCQGMDETL